MIGTLAYLAGYATRPAAWLADRAWRGVDAVVCGWANLTDDGDER